MCAFYAHHQTSLILCLTYIDVGIFIYWVLELLVIVCFTSLVARNWYNIFTYLRSFENALCSTGIIHLSEELVSDASLQLSYLFSVPGCITLCMWTWCFFHAHSYEYSMKWAAFRKKKIWCWSVVWSKKQVKTLSTLRPGFGSLRCRQWLPQHVRNVLDSFSWDKL